MQEEKDLVLEKDQDYEKQIENEEPPFVEYDITSYPADYTLSVLWQMFKNGNITIPSFQRGYVWSQKQASALIESFLMGLPVPPVFFYIDSENKNLVIDGQQRLMSIFFYFEGYFGQENEKGKRQTFRLTGLNKQSPYYNLRFDDLQEQEINCKEDVAKWNYVTKGANNCSDWRAYEGGIEQSANYPLLSLIQKSGNATFGKNDETVRHRLSSSDLLKKGSVFTFDKYSKFLNKTLVSQEYMNNSEVFPYEITVDNINEDSCVVTVAKVNNGQTRS